jgi:hypothetical protein
MSTDCIALFDAPAGPGVLDLLHARFKADSSPFAELIEIYGKHWRPKSWSIESLSGVGDPELVGPGGFAMSFEPKILTMYHMMRFQTFTDDPRSQALLRAACRLVAGVVGSRRAIYTHEMMPHDGEDLAAIEVALRERIGPPAASLAALHGAELFSPGAWYVEAFENVG